MKNKIIPIIVSIAIFQIFLLISAMFAYPYLIHEAEKSNTQTSISEKGQNNLIKKSLVLLSGILSIKQIGTVSAGSLTNQTIYSSPEYSIVTSSPSSALIGCCLELKSGAICEDVLRENAQSCKASLLPAECSQVDPCKLGCCVDSKSGTCTPNAPKGKCIAEGGTWDSETKCRVTECQKGCCVLGSGAQFANEKTCESLSILYGFEKEFKDLNTELDCIALVATQEMGACVYPGGGCSFKTEKECLQNSGIFHKESLCSNPSLETSCTKQASVGCLEGKDEIYWFDSCGNVENIYSSNKEVSWNSGKLLSKAQSCNPSSSNINSTTCGNCNRALSSVCSASSDKKIADGNFICKSLECGDADGKKRENGESWCVYDSYIGDGRDTAGSEHWRAFCNKGVVEVDRCGDYRGRICVQSIMESGTKNFSVAACATNTAFECTMYNGEDSSRMKKLCEENEYCLIKNVNIASGFSFDYCTARYPKGFNTDLFETNNKVCSAANLKCSVIYKKDWKGRWSCSENCECERKIFTDKMNDLCISLGDCGSYINFKGGGTDNARVSGAPAINWKEYISYATPVKGQYVKSQDLNASLYLLLGGVVPLDLDEEDSSKKAADVVGKVSGGTGLVAYGVSYAFAQGAAIIGAKATADALAAGATAEIAKLAGTTAASGSASGAIAAATASIAICAAGAAIGAMLGSYIASSQGITGTPAVIMTLAGAVAGATAAYIFILKGSWAGGPYVLIIAIVIILIISLLGWGKTSVRTVEFTCLPWEAPLGGDDCKKCNDDSLRPCTEYRCNSLGQACILLNAESEIPTCQSLPKDSVPPIISPGEPSEGYKFENITENGLRIVGEAKDCIQEFTPVSFTLKTDEFAQCIFSATLPQSKQFEDMGEMGYPKEGNAFTINHTLGIFMPSLSSLSVYDVNGTLKEKFGKMSLYIRCRDYWGNYNLDEYIVNFCINSGPDVMPVNHLYTTTNPKTNSILKYGTTEIPVEMYINEPAECKYSSSSGKTYDEMENSMNCETDVMNPTNFGWQCNTTLSGLKKENKIYIKCKDQPWFAGTINETDRNINQEDYEYALYVSKSELNITGTYPTGKVESGFEPISLEIEVRTAGGAQDGVCICYWGENLDIPFWESFSTVHKQTLSTIISGEYSIPVKCSDSAGNIATSEINFTVELDTTPPMAIRAYREGTQLIVLTDEKAECYYTLNTCDFDATNATSMTTALSTTHKAPWEPGETYYVKCKDTWGNTNPWCAIRVQPE